MFKLLAKNSEKNIEKFRRKWSIRRIFVDDCAHSAHPLGPIWAKRQISQYGTKHLFIALSMLKLLAKKSKKILKTFEENDLDVLRWTIGNPSQTCRWPFRSPLSPITREPDFSRTLCSFSLSKKKCTLMDWIFIKFAKTLFLGHFDPFLLKNREIRFFPENRDLFGHSR